MKKQFFLLIAFLFSLAFVLSRPSLAQAQDEGLRLNLRKVVGYSSLSLGEIQGSMSMQASGPENLVRVVFYIDDQVMGEANQAPFKLGFNTGSYSLGSHTLYAVGTTQDGSELRSNEVTTKFVTAERGWQSGLKIAGPILLIVLAAMLFSVLVPVLMNRGKNVELPLGAERNYGIAGGAICPRCGRPFSLHTFSINLSPVHKFDRCPYCGKWAPMRRRSLNELRAAEAAELQQAQEAGQVPALSEEEKLRKELENSRYHEI